MGANTAVLISRAANRVSACMRELSQSEHELSQIDRDDMAAHLRERAWYRVRCARRDLANAEVAWQQAQRAAVSA